MKPGQVMTKWWQDLVAGRLRTPQDIHAASRAETPDPWEDRFTAEPTSVRFDAPKRLAAPQFLASENYARQGFRADWQEVNPTLRQWAARVCLDAKARGIPLYVHSAFRSKAQQDDLVSRRVTRAAWPRSAHNIGEAVDIVHGVYHWDLTQDEWFFIHHLGLDALRRVNASLPKAKQIALNWGGNDRTGSDTFAWDPAHWEIADFRKRIREIVPGVPIHMPPKALIRQ
jgi:hypothetical protein